MAKILNIISDTNIGGAGRSLINYLNYCDRENFPASMVLPRGSALKEAVESLGVTVYEVDGMADKSFAPRAIAPLCALIREIDPDLVHSHGSLSGRIAARLCGKKVIYTKHCAFPPEGFRASAAARLAVRVLDTFLSDGVIAVGPAARDILMREGIPGKKIHEIYNGVAPLRSPTKEERAAARAEFGFSEDDFVVGMLARIEPYKGQSLLMDAAEQLLREGRRLKLLIVGDGSDRERLLRRAAEFPEGTVCLPGFRSDVENILWCMDVQVNASTESEASPLSLMEGMSLKLPAVVSSVGGNPYHIENEKNGFVFPNGDTAALGRCIARLMDDRALYDEMAETALETYRRRFTGEVYAGNVESIYQTILKGTKRA